MTTRAPARERPGHGLADSRTAPGDDGHPAVKGEQAIQEIGHRPSRSGRARTGASPRSAVRARAGADQRQRAGRQPAAAGQRFLGGFLSSHGGRNRRRRRPRRRCGPRTSPPAAREPGPGPARWRTARRRRPVSPPHAGTRRSAPGSPARVVPAGEHGPCASLTNSRVAPLVICRNGSAPTRSSGADEAPSTETLMSARAPAPSRSRRLPWNPRSAACNRRRAGGSRA